MQRKERIEREKKARKEVLKKIQRIKAEERFQKIYKEILEGKR